MELQPKDGLEKKPKHIANKILQLSFNYIACNIGCVTLLDFQLDAQNSYLFTYVYDYPDRFFRAFSSVVRQMPG